jgi:hydrogenase/urease accessory protein HupE
MEFPVLAGMPFGHRMMLALDNAPEPVGLLDARHQTWEVPSRIDTGSSSSPSATTLTMPVRVSWFSFVLLGIEHILTGFDHLCFLLALLLVAPRLRDVLTVVTTFTIAHSLTLAAAAFGAVSLSSSIVEPLIAASIVYIGLENLFLHRQPRYRLAVVFGFGLIHGLGFASGLAERLPGVTGLAVVPPLLGFNAGVELGQLAVAACLVPLIQWAKTRPSFSIRMQPVCSFAIATAGFVWLLQRV